MVEHNQIEFFSHACDTTSHSPRSKSCPPPPPTNGTCNALNFLHPANILLALANIYPPSSQKGDDASLVLEY